MAFITPVAAVMFLQGLLDPAIIWILIPLTALAIPIFAILTGPISLRMKQAERKEARQLYERIEKGQVLVSYPSGKERGPFPANRAGVRIRRGLLPGEIRVVFRPSSTLIPTARRIQTLQLWHEHNRGASKPGSSPLP